MLQQYSRTPSSLSISESLQSVSNLGSVSTPTLFFNLSLYAGISVYLYAFNLLVLSQLLQPLSFSGNFTDFTTSRLQSERLHLVNLVSNHRGYVSHSH